MKNNNIILTVYYFNDESRSSKSLRLILNQVGNMLFILFILHILLKYGYNTIK